MNINTWQQGCFIDKPIWTREEKELAIINGRIRIRVRSYPTGNATGKSNGQDIINYVHEKLK
jgi:hypothetical protein